MTIGVLSDIHYGVSDVYEADRQEARDTIISISDTFEEQDVDTVFLLGDIIHETTYIDDIERMQWVAKQFDSFNTIAIPGNHDVHNIGMDEFVNIWGNNLNTTRTIGGTDSVVVVDTAYESPMDNVGKISERGLELISQAESDELIILSHYPVLYTDVYQEFFAFEQNPEGVFPINKHDVEVIIEDSDMDVLNVSGHTHVSGEFEPSSSSKVVSIEPVFDFIENTHVEDAYYIGESVSEIFGNR